MHYTTCLLVALGVCAAGELGAAQIFFGTGDNVNSTVANFRAAIGGGSVAGAGGSFGGIRREINWDGVPNSASDPNPFAGNFFNNRGVAFSTNGTSLINSAGPGAASLPLFESFDGPGQGNGTYNFQAFSGGKIFSVLGDNDLTVDFVLPGTTTPTFTKAFGAIFVCSDRSIECPASLRVEDAQGNNFGAFGVTLNASSGFHFIGFWAEGNEEIHRAVMTFGDRELGQPNGQENGQVAALDDFIYGEAGNANAGSAVPEPGTYVMLGSSLIGLALLRRRS